jgi:hypothetical protein
MFKRLDVPTIPFRPTDEMFFDSHDLSKPNLSFLKNHFYQEGRVTEDQALFIIRTGTELLRHEPNVLELDAPITGLIFSREWSDVIKFAVISMDSITI